MLNKLLKLLSSQKSRRRYSSSDRYRRRPSQHPAKYGQSYYKKKRRSFSSYSS